MSETSLLNKPLTDMRKGHYVAMDSASATSNFLCACTTHSDIETLMVGKPEENRFCIASIQSDFHSTSRRSCESVQACRKRSGYVLYSLLFIVYSCDYQIASYGPGVHTVSLRRSLRIVQRAVTTVSACTRRSSLVLDHAPFQGRWLVVSE